MYRYIKHLRGTFFNYFIALIIFSSFVFLSTFSIIMSESSRINLEEFKIIPRDPSKDKKIMRISVIISTLVFILLMI
ncbi:MAG: hypothetical protein HUJ77_05660 [Clostridium sp.]|uniref:hypothetical protein n=1 Tax=Clostridium sp. TaxID=1506 RepID=UPI0025BCEC24|nr:hypothetical protein [Clostridium sp.]MCF0147868.1 hypothetical protein [Clostridium sp.]